MSSPETRANASPRTHMRNSAVKPYLSAMNLCISSCSTKPTPIVMRARTNVHSRLRYCGTPFSVTPSLELKPPRSPPVTAP